MVVFLYIHFFHMELEYLRDETAMENQIPDFVKRTFSKIVFVKLNFDIL